MYVHQRTGGTSRKCTVRVHTTLAPLPQNCPDFTVITPNYGGKSRKRPNQPNVKCRVLYYLTVCGVSLYIGRVMQPRELTRAGDLPARRRTGHSFRSAGLEVEDRAAPKQEFHLCMSTF